MNLNSLPHSLAFQYQIILQAGMWKTILYLWLQQQKVTNNNYVCVCPFEMLARIIPIVLPPQSHMSSILFFGGFLSTGYDAECVFYCCTLFKKCFVGKK